jgi:hypothetical protein
MSASAPDLGRAVRTLKAPRAVALGRRSVATLTAPPAVIAIVIVAICAGFAAIGADARWLAALGRVIVARHSVPSGVPFAAAPSAHFPNVLVLAEIIFYQLEHAFGDRGLMLAQMLAVGIAVTVLARDAIAAGGSNRGVAVALGIATLGALPSIAIIRVQLFSLALFPVLVMLLRSEARRPSSRIWLVVPLFALWSNLHAAVLIGFGVTCCYLVLSRLRLQPVLTVLVGGTAALALCLTPALARTITYYHLGLTNVSVQRGFGLWAPLSPHQPFDVVLVGAAVVLALGLRRARPALWELVALLALGAATIKGSRDGIWLLFFLVAPGACAFRFTRRWNRLAAPVVTLAVAAIVFSLVRGPVRSGASKTTVARAVELAHGSAVLAPDINAEQVALAGGRVWLSNPLEAFSRHYQALYIDWLEGLPSGRAAVTGDVNVALVPAGSDTAKLMDGERNFVAAFSDHKTVLYVRKTASTSRLRETAGTG